MGMDLSHGGHLTHGSPVNQSGAWFKVIHYGVRKEDERIDYDQVRDLALKHRPKMIIAGASAYPASSTSRFSGKSPMRPAPCSWWTWPTLRVSWPRGASQPGSLCGFRYHHNPQDPAGTKGGMILTTKEHAKAIDKAVFPGMQGARSCM